MQDFWFIALNFYLLLIILVNFLKFRYPYSINPLFFFSVGSMLFVSLPFFVDPVMRYEKEYQDFTYVAIYTMIGITGFLLGYLIKIGPRHLNRNMEKIPKKRIGILYIIIFFFVGFTTQALIFKLLGISIIDKILLIRAPAGSAFNIWESFWRFPYLFSYGLINSSVLFAIYLVINGKIRKIYIPLLLVLYILGLVINFSTGTRMFLFSYLLFPIICYMYNEKKILSFRFLSLSPIIIILLLYLIAFLSSYRDTGIREAGIKVSFINVATYGLNQVIDFQRAIDIFSEGNLLYGSTFFALLVNPIPRELWPNKPVGIGAIMGNIDILSRQGVSVSITIFGESFANFGPFGVFFVPFIFGLILRKLYIYYRTNENMYRSVIYLYVLSFLPNEVRGGFLEVTMKYLTELGFLVLLMKLSLNSVKKTY